MTEKFIVGLVGAPFGIKGFVKVRPPSGEIEHLLKLQSAIVSKGGEERTLNIEESAPSSQSVLMRFAGIDSPEKAKTLSGAVLLAGREQAATLGEGEFYIEDLKGLAVVAEGGETIGHITDIIEGGGGELVEIKLAASGGPDHLQWSGKEKRLVPFRKEFFSTISPAEGKVILQNLWILE